MMNGTVPQVPHHHHARLVRTRPARHHARNERLQRMMFASPIRGSQESLLRQNLRVDQDDLVRIQTDSQLESLTQSNALVALPDNNRVSVASNLPLNRRYCQPWTRAFLEDFGAKYYTTFHQPLMVTSAVRTVAFQEHLRRHNRNAAEAEGDLASPHLTGAAIDIAKRGLTRKQLDWARDYLLQSQNNGYLDVEEEFRQRVFHITVYKDYELANPREAATVAQPQTVLQSPSSTEASQPTSLPATQTDSTDTQAQPQPPQ